MPGLRITSVLLTVACHHFDLLGKHSHYNTIDGFSKHQVGVMMKSASNVSCTGSYKGGLVIAP